VGRPAAAREALHHREVPIGGLTLKWKALLEDFERAKMTCEQECRTAIAPIRAVHERYLERTNEGIRTHFELTACALSLPVPKDYPWEVLYDATDRILQLVVGHSDEGFCFGIKDGIKRAGRNGKILVVATDYCRVRSLPPQPIEITQQSHFVPGLHSERFSV
jgi:hypothetical protein